MCVHVRVYVHIYVHTHIFLYIWVGRYSGMLLESLIIDLNLMVALLNEAQPARLELGAVLMEFGFISSPVTI